MIGSHIWLYFFSPCIGAVVGAVTVFLVRASHSRLLKAATALTGGNLSLLLISKPLIRTGARLPPPPRLHWERIFFTPFYLQHRHAIALYGLGVLLTTVLLWAVIIVRLLFPRLRMEQPIGASV